MTKWIRLRETLSGGRADGRPWPPANIEAIEVEDWEAEHNVNAGWAYYTDPPEPEPEPEPARVREPVKSPEPEPAKAQAKAQEGLAPPVTVPDPPDSPEPADHDVPEPPRPSDPKQDWVDYAVGQGMDPEKAAANSKADLMSRFGGRL